MPEVLAPELITVPDVRVLTPQVRPPETVAVPAPELEVQETLVSPAQRVSLEGPGLPTAQTAGDAVTDYREMSDPSLEETGTALDISRAEGKPKVMSANFEVSINVTPTIHTTERVDPAQLSREIGAQMRSELREAFRGVFADTGMRFA
jgi:hypothetical protein